MNEYILEKEFKTLESITTSSEDQKIENFYFANERPSSEFKIKNRVINHCSFLNLGLKSASIDNTDFSHCVFIECYFKKSFFSQVNFTNCKFIKCNLEDVNVISSNFNYALFKDCYIDFEVIQASLPKSSNLRWRLCTNLALEALRLGNDLQFRKYFFAEKASSEQHFLSMFTKKEEYYKKHYSGWQSIEGLFKFITSKLSKRLWGYGEKISYLIFNILFVIIAFSSFYFFSGSVFKINGNANLTSIGVVDSIYFSLCNFITITSDITSANQFVRNLTAVEGFLGVMLMGFFIAALFRFINRR